MSEGRVAEIIVQKPINASETAFNYRTSHHEHNPFYNSEASHLFTSDVSERHHFRRHTEIRPITHFYRDDFLSVQ
mgnify:CR=1 FL=1